MCSAQTEKSDNTPTSKALEIKAKSLTALIEKNKQRHREDCDIAAEVIHAVERAGLFRAYQPRHWGGHEMAPVDFFVVQNIFAESCLSTAWVYGVLSIHSFVLALFDQQAQADVWQNSPSALASSSFQPLGKVKQVEGGFRLTGRWPFSSGSTYAQWVIVGALVKPAVDKPPALTLFLVPRSDYTIIDNWDTIGLRGTGSNDVEMHDVFVPSYRTLLPTAGIVPDIPATDNRSPLYQLPWLYMFTSSISNLAIGASRAALNAFLSVEKNRISTRTGKSGGGDPIVHHTASRLSAEIEAAIAMFHHHQATFQRHINNNDPMTTEQGYLLRIQVTSVMRKLSAIVDEMQLLLGARGIRVASPLTQIWLDLSAAKTHLGNDPRTSQAVFGQMLFKESP
jgi:3-hydroxy-9,10-secoandrosta-1,3,5(10)-triene-9,17-dione monooxygenase